MPSRLITPPTDNPLSLLECKMHLRVTSDSEDALIDSLISAASDLCEHETGRSLMPQTWELSLPGFENEMCLPHAPVASITSIKYTDVNGSEQTLSLTEYVFDNAGEINPRVVLAVGKAWPAVYSGINNVRIRYIAGYANAAAVPKALRQWMLLQISYWYRNRESAGVAGFVEMPFVQHLINAYRIYSL